MISKDDFLPSQSGFDQLGHVASKILYFNGFHSAKRSG